MTEDATKGKSVPEGSTPETKISIDQMVEKLAKTETDLAEAQNTIKQLTDKCLEQANILGARDRKDMIGTLLATKRVKIEDIQDKTNEQLADMIKHADIFIGKQNIHPKIANDTMDERFTLPDVYAESRKALTQGRR